MKKKRSPRRPWTDDSEIEKLKQLHADGRSMAQIGHELGRTRNSILTKCRVLNLPDRERPAGGKRAVLFDEAKLEILHAGFASKLTIDEMADSCDVTRDQLRKKLVTLGLSIAERDGISPRGSKRATTSVRGKDGNTANLGKIRAVVAYREPPRDPQAPPSARDAGGELFSMLSIPNSGACKWPHGEVGSPQFHLCGQRTSGAPYCEFHEGRKRGVARPPTEKFQIEGVAARVFR